ncbi:DUF1643 domain-containing protein [Achromobacter anxifer]|uniref:DUF1643 domain-containing protein n=1 Tax=Achromobacter anxifer TaxID=1287737 RepID=UPI0023F73072|nr:DUF1643 domain-containing protein [Achromobacter anxifer]MDF8359428.1 DUF1643 domain-containing protein [Achromobacter anxifer]
MTNYATAALGSAAPLPATQVDALITQRTVFNSERTHRFTLFRHWGDPDDYACGISMNPSGAAEDVDDPTVDGMVRRAQELWGVGAYYQLNVLSIRGTYSSELPNAAVVNLPENDAWIRRIAAKARIVVVSWGNEGHKSGRGLSVETILRDVCALERVFCFGKNKNGSPVHPLYQPHAATLIPYFD